MAQVWLGCVPRPDSVQIRLRFGPGLALLGGKVVQIRFRCGSAFVQVWFRFGSVWFKDGSKMVQIWFRFGSGCARFRAKAV